MEKVEEMLDVLWSKRVGGDLRQGAMFRLGLCVAIVKKPDGQDPGRELEIAWHHLGPLRIELLANYPHRAGRSRPAADRRIALTTSACRRRSGRYNGAQFRQRAGLQANVLLLARAVNKRKEGTFSRYGPVPQQRADHRLQCHVAESLTNRHLVPVFQTCR